MVSALNRYESSKIINGHGLEPVVKLQVYSERKYFKQFVVSKHVALIWRIDVISLHEEDKRKDMTQRLHTCQNPKRHMPLVSLLL